MHATKVTFEKWSEKVEAYSKLISETHLNQWSHFLGWTKFSMPSIMSLALFCYLKHSDLFVNSSTVDSQSGVQQAIHWVNFCFHWPSGFSLMKLKANYPTSRQFSICDRSTICPWYFAFLPGCPQTGRLFAIKFSFERKIIRFGSGCNLWRNPGSCEVKYQASPQSTKTFVGIRRSAFQVQAAYVGSVLQLPVLVGHDPSKDISYVKAIEELGKIAQHPFKKTWEEFHNSA